MCNQSELEESRVMEAKYRKVLAYLIHQDWFQEKAEYYFELPETETNEQFTTELICEIGRRLEKEGKQQLN